MLQWREGVVRVEAEAQQLQDRMLYGPSAKMAHLFTPFYRRFINHSKISWRIDNCYDASHKARLGAAGNLSSRLRVIN